MEELRRMVLAAVGDRPIDVYLFGSRARGGARPLSDADIALDGHGRPLDRNWLAALREALEDSLIPFRVDIVDLSEASPALREAVQREGIRWTP